MKQRRPRQRTSASAISGFLARRNFAVKEVRSDILGGDWVVVVHCISPSQTTAVWVALRENGYAMFDRYHTWVIVKESAL